jgi:hypothetical protein
VHLAHPAFPAPSVFGRMLGIARARGVARVLFRVM